MTRTAFVRRALPAPAVLAIAVILSLPAAAGAARRDEMMLHVDPATRVEQRCNARAMGEVERQHRDMQPEEVVAYAFADPALAAASIAAPGAALRSHGHWYHLAYRCRTSPDGMDVMAFTYTLGAEVPRAEWDAHSLVP